MKRIFSMLKKIELDCLLGGLIRLNKRNCEEFDPIRDIVPRTSKGRSLFDVCCKVAEKRVRVNTFE